MGQPGLAVNRRALLALLVPLLLAAVAVAPAASAHGPPAPREQDVRLLSDQNDDCGDHDAGSLSACRGTHDLVALDVREAYDDALGDVLAFRLLLNGGDPAGGLRDTITFTAGGRLRTFELTTSDNGQFDGDFQQVGEAESARDGTRFWVEAAVSLRELGVAPGDRIAGFQVEAWKGGTKGDVMPGTYQTALGGQGPPSDSELADPQATQRPDYTLRGPTYYASLELPGPLTLAAGEQATATVRVASLLRQAAQSAQITAEVEGGSDLQVRFRQASGLPPQALHRFHLPADAEVELEVVADGAAAGDFPVVVTVRTDLGGRAVAQMTVRVEPGAGADDPDDPDGPGDTGTDGRSDGKGSPAVSPVAMLLAFLALGALAARRGRGGPRSPR